MDPTPRPARPAGTPTMVGPTIASVPFARGITGEAKAISPLAGLADGGLQDVHSPFGAHGGLVRHALFDRTNEAPLVWVQDVRAERELGTLGATGAWFAHGLPGRTLLRVRARNATQALWAMEEAVRAGACVVGEVWGAPRVLDFTATRRLELFSRAGGVSCLLVRLGRDTAESSSGARWRWRITPHPSAPDPFDPRAPGAPRWMLELVRARTRPPGRWVVEAAPADARAGSDHDAAAHGLRVVPALADGDVAAQRAAQGQTGGTVVAFPRAGCAA